MAANKSASKESSSRKRVDATKTPSQASEKSKVENRRPAVAPGDLAGAEYNPARTAEGDRVAATGANPAASRAGVFRLIEVAGSPVKITVTDGARASLAVDKHDALTQSDLQTIRGQIDQAIQETT